MVETCVSGSAERAAGIAEMGTDEQVFGCIDCMQAEIEYESVVMRHARLSMQADRLAIEVRRGTDGAYESWKSAIRARDEVQEQMLDAAAKMREHWGTHGGDGPRS